MAAGSARFGGDRVFDGAGWQLEITSGLGAYRLCLTGRACVDVGEPRLETGVCVAVTGLQGVAVRVVAYRNAP